MTGAPAPRTSVPDRRTTRRTFALLAIVALAPVVASYVAYYVFPRGEFVNYGTLLAAPAPPLQGTMPDGSAVPTDLLRGKWTLVVAAPGACDPACRQALYATRQSRTMQGRNADRVQRLWLVTDGTTPAADLLSQHPGVVIVFAPGDPLAAWPGGSEPLYLVDPLGNLVTRYPRDPDIRALAKDLGRVLRASGIG